jgi:hypothetical protein
MFAIFRGKPDGAKFPRRCFSHQTKHVIRDPNLRSRRPCRLDAIKPRYRESAKRYLPDGGNRESTEEIHGMVEAKRVILEKRQVATVETGKSSQQTETTRGARIPVPPPLIFLGLVGRFRFTIYITAAGKRASCTRLRGRKYLKIMVTEEGGRPSLLRRSRHQPLWLGSGLMRS